MLTYTKTYPLQVVLGVMVDLSQAPVNEGWPRLLPVLGAALERVGVLPEREGRAFARHKRQPREPQDWIIDGTERRRQRPKSPKKQAQPYRGRKKMHSDKNLVIVNTHSQRVGYLSPTVAGKHQDKAVAEQDHSAYPPRTVLRQDTGFQGYQPAGCHVQQAKKSLAGGRGLLASAATPALSVASEGVWNMRSPGSSAVVLSKTPCGTPLLTSLSA